MSENEEIFQEYMEENGGLSNWFKRPKSWLIIFSILAAIVLLIVFYYGTIKGGMSPQEVENSIQVVWQDTKWVQKEKTPYDIKIVPAIAFKIKNTGQRALDYVSFEGVFEFEETGKVHTDGAAHAFSDKSLEPGEESGEIFIRAFYGYSARTLDSFVSNKDYWKPMRVKLFARTRGSGPVRIGDYYPVKQVIEGYTPQPQAVGGELTDPKAKESFEKFGKAIQLLNTSSIWEFKLRTRTKIVIVPTFTFHVKNVGQEALKGIIFKGEFLFTDTGEKLGEGLDMSLKKALPPGDTTGDITLKADLGYEATSSGDFVINTETWRSVEIKVFAKQKDYTYIHLGTYPIRRKIEGVE